MQRIKPDVCALRRSQRCVEKALKKEMWVARHRQTGGSYHPKDPKCARTKAIKEGSTGIREGSLKLHSGALKGQRSPLAQHRQTESSHTNTRKRKPTMGKTDKIKTIGDLRKDPRACSGGKQGYRSQGKETCVRGRELGKNKMSAKRAMSRARHTRGRGSCSKKKKSMVSGGGSMMGIKKGGDRE